MKEAASIADVSDTVALVPAAGRGERLGAGGPKALVHLAGLPLIVHAVRRMAAAPSVGAVVVAAPPGALGAINHVLAPFAADTELIVVEGGASRQESVAAALAAAPDGLEIVLVHDAARALAPPELADEVAASVRAGHDAVIPVLPVVDTIKQVDADGNVVATVDRSALRAVQTPQGFRRKVLVAAHANVSTVVTDDAGLVEQLGLPVHTVPGREVALKITRPYDLAFAEAIATKDKRFATHLASFRT